MSEAADPFSVECILDGFPSAKDRSSSIAVHGEKLYVGHASGSLSVYRLPPSATSLSVDDAGPSQSGSAPKAKLLSTHPGFNPAHKPLLNLRIVPSLSLILSSTAEGALLFHSLATFEAVEPPSPIRSDVVRGLYAFEVHTSVVEWPDEVAVPIIEVPSANDRRGQGSQTLPRRSGASVGSSTSRQTVRPKSMYKSRDGDQGGEEPTFRLLTTLLVSLRRKVVALRWLDGTPWDWKETQLAHSPRTIVFAPVDPNASEKASVDHACPVFLSYGTPSDFALLTIPAAHESSAFKARATKTASAQKKAFLHDDRSWPKIRELNIPEYAADVGGPGDLGAIDGSDTQSMEAPARRSAGITSSDQQIGRTSLQNQGGGFFGGLGGYIGLSGRSKAPILRSVPRSVLSGTSGPSDESVSEDEVIVVRDQAAVFLSFATGNPTRRRGLDWPVPVDDVALLPSQFLFAALPGSSSSSKPTIQIRSTKDLNVVQSAILPPMGPRSSSETSSNTTYSISALLAPPSQATSASSAVYAVLTPSAANESARLYKLAPRSWKTRLHEMIRQKRWEDALDLVRTGVPDSDLELHDGTKGQFARDRLAAPLLALFSLERYLAAATAAANRQMQTAHSAFEAAVELWIELDLNPAKVLCIFPERIAGLGLAKPRSEWLQTWGGDLETEGFSLEGIQLEDDTTPPGSHIRPAKSRRGSLESVASTRTAAVSSAKDKSRLPGLFGRATRPISSVTNNDASSPTLTPAELSSSPDQAGQDSAKPPQVGKDSHDATKSLPSSTNKSASLHPNSSDSGSIRGVGTTSRPASIRQPEVSVPEEGLLMSRVSLEALGRFLADRRRIFKPILESQPHSHDSAASPAALLSLPSIPLPSMTLSDLTSLARVVDTALFKTFLETKPSLVGPLCRIDNWCEVNEVEGILEAKGKYSDLISLYSGKKMHDRALRLLRKFAEDEDDEEEKTGPTIRYLQALGAEHIDVILENAKWVLSVDKKRGMDIFTADTGKVSQLPRLEIVKLLWDLDRDLCAEYLEHIIETVGDGDPEVHEKLALIYLGRIEKAKRGERDGSTVEEDTKKLLDFLISSQQYRPERLLSRVPSDDLWEVRAILLGRLGQHRGALGIYVGKIGGTAGEEKAEVYCSAVYKTATTDEERDVFLLLLKLYLEPRSDSKAQPGKPPSADTVAHPTPHDLAPALRLLSRHPASFDCSSVLSLLPPFLSLSSLSTFLFKSLQASHSHTAHSRIIASLSGERQVQVDEELAKLRKRRIKVTQGRTCDICGKRLGVSVLAVSNRGQVRHYGCMSE